MSNVPEPFTAEDYFSLLLRRAQQAESEGNYAISAAAVALIDTFLNSRERLDSHLSEHGTLDLASLGEAVLAARQDALSASAATTLRLS